MFGYFRYTQGLSGKAKEKLPKTAKIQQLKWHQTLVFKLLDEAQHASTELSHPENKRTILRRGKDLRITIYVAENCAFFNLKKENQFSCFPDIIETNSNLEALEADAPSCGISGLVNLPLRPTPYIG